MANMDKSKPSRANANSQICKEKDLIDNGVSLFNLMLYISQKCPIQMLPPLLIGNWKANLQMDTFPNRTWGSWTFGHSWQFWGLFSEAITIWLYQQKLFFGVINDNFVWKLLNIQFWIQVSRPSFKRMIGLPGHICSQHFACGKALFGDLLSSISWIGELKKGIE